MKEQNHIGRKVQPLDPRRAFERADARMIQEDHSAMANLPTEPINKEFTHKDWTNG